MFDTSNYNLPELTLSGLDRYVHERIPCGGFLTAVLSNDLFGAYAKADLTNTIAMSQIVKFIYNEIPSGCWGSREKVDAWLSKRD